MINDLRNLFRNSWDSLLSELGRREPEDEVAELLSAMRQEMVEARAALPEYARAQEEAERALAKERQALADCERRQGLAERIGDAETARVAAEFAARHAEHVQVLEKRCEAARAERELHAREAEEMMRAYKKADAERFALVARLRSERARGRVAGASGALWEEMARMEESVSDEARYADALDELGTTPPASSPPAMDVDARLAELKRRMGK
jgi:phage shock protein A